MTDVKDYAVQTRVEKLYPMTSSYNEYMERTKEERENQAIVAAVRQVPENTWIVLSRESTIVKDENPYYETHQVRITCRATENYRVYVPVYENYIMPNDVYKCDYCHGYTKNDSVGNCAACGARRLY